MEGKGKGKFYYDNSRNEGKTASCRHKMENGLIWMKYVIHTGRKWVEI